MERYRARMEGDDNIPFHIGKVSYEKREGILARIDGVFDRADEILEKAFSVLLLRYGHEEKMRGLLNEINFEYLEEILKKIVKNSFGASGKEYRNFKLSQDSVTLDSDIRGGGEATQTGYLKINPTMLGKMIKKNEMNDDNYRFTVTLVVAHEAIHLIAAKGEKDTGFQKEKTFISANEAMTELLARAVSVAYQDFTNTSSREGWLYFPAYSDDIKYLLALMAIIARDNMIAIESVIQAFTVSYFSDNSVLDNFSQFANISDDAKKIVEILKVERGNESTFDITQFHFDEETKNLIESITGGDRNDIVRTALHIK